MSRPEMIVEEDARKNCRYVLLLADIHANEAALTAVVEDAYRRYVGHRLSVWFLGDLFGRGPNPADVWQMLVDLEPDAVVAGNHDWGVTGRYQNVLVNGRYDGLYSATDWEVILAHRQELISLNLLESDRGGNLIGGEVLETINKWPVVSVPHPHIYMIHGGWEKPFTPPDNLSRLYNEFIWSYVKEKRHAQFTIQAALWLQLNWPESDCIQSLNGEPRSPRLIIVGHYHKRFYYNEITSRWIAPVKLDYRYMLPQQQGTAVISPGSVGFPREENDRDASYAVLCLSGSKVRDVTFYTTPYDRQAVRGEMKAKGYPNAVTRRLYLLGEPEHKDL